MSVLKLKLRALHKLTMNSHPRPAVVAIADPDRSKISVRPEYDIRWVFGEELHEDLLLLLAVDDG